MEIIGKITGIRYDIKVTETLQRFEIENFNINDATSACIVTDGDRTFAISKWVSPKRTRSYPYERVYNTLNSAKKITVIPVVKDEGAAGDRDFIQWDTVSLMSLLDVFVIFAFYEKADAHDEKITNQKFSNSFVLNKLHEIFTYHSSALHWNLNELEHHFDDILEQSQSSYAQINQETGVRLHQAKGIENFRKRINRDVEKFMQFSRQKAQEAQRREFVTTQPKEVLSTLTKAKITIANYLGGFYFFTVDEILIVNQKLQLIEAKHSRNTVLPSKSDIKDGLLKMILYSNLKDVSVDGQHFEAEAILKLTSNRVINRIDSSDTEGVFESFCESNNISETQRLFLIQLFLEAKTNNFTIKIEPA